MHSLQSDISSNKAKTGSWGGQVKKHLRYGGDSWTSKAVVVHKQIHGVSVLLKFLGKRRLENL